ncbi:MAG: citrate lyase acyl carrier protein [Bacillota bacterium]|jgi:citrate lyase subunit gamma (acyl carrier protein)
MQFRPAQAGSLESGDVMVRVTPSDSGTLSIRIESKVSPRFSGAIQQTVREVAADMGVSAAHCEVIDRGALDFVLRARVTTALRRAMEVEKDE